MKKKEQRVHPDLSEIIREYEPLMKGKPLPPSVTKPESENIDKTEVMSVNSNITESVEPPVQEEILPASIDDEHIDEYKEAKEKAAAILNFTAPADKSDKNKSETSAVAMELMVLEIISIMLFIVSMSSMSGGPLSFIAVILPVMVGVGYRMLAKQLSLREAVSKCKLHIVISCILFVCIALAMV